MPKGTDPGMFIGQPERHGQRHDRQAGLLLHPFRRLGLRHQLLHHLDVQVGPQRSRFALRQRPASPSPSLPANCAGATEIYGLFRSTFGFNEIFNTKAFTMGPLQQRLVRSRHGCQHREQLSGAGQARRRRRSAVRLRPALQGLRQRRTLDVLGVLQPQLLHPVRQRFAPAIPGPTCNSPTATSRTSRHGRSKSTTTWISASCRRTCSTSRSAAAPAGTAEGSDIERLPALSGPDGSSPPPRSSSTRTDPSDLRRFSKAFWGPKYSHFVDVWVAYRYWQNKFGLDHNAPSAACSALGGVTRPSSSLHRVDRSIPASR